MSEVVDNKALGRFERIEDGMLSFADYELRGDTLVLPHVESHPDLRGRGAAGRLMEGVLAVAHQQGWKVLPLCSYAAAYIRRHPEHSSLFAG